MNFTVIVLSGIDRNLSIALSVSSAWNPPFIRLLGPPLGRVTPRIKMKIMVVYPKPVTGCLKCTVDCFNDSFLLLF